MVTDNDNTKDAQVTKNSTQDQSSNAPVKDEKVEEALRQAEHDIDHDPDFKPNPNDDLDEGEIARLGDEETEPA
jgi:hypothetical protein